MIPPLPLSPLALVALLSLAAWAVVLLTRRRFWRCDQRLGQNTMAPGAAPAVVAVIPARDEAHTIGQTVRSLLNQSYPGRLVVVVVDDSSSDGTADAARAGAASVYDGPSRLIVVPGKPLEAGWSGKLWAVHQGLEVAAQAVPEARYVLLTDADIEHIPGNIARLVGKCERDGLVMASLMVKLRCESAWEHLLIPAFIFFFQKLYPFPLVNDPDHRTAGAAGGCILARRETLDAIGGVAALRGALIDDCALAALLKEKGPIWLGLAGRTRSLRPNDELGDIWRMVARTAYVQLHHSPLRLIGAVIGMTLLYLVPPVALIVGILSADFPAAVAGLVGWIGLAILYRPTLHLYRRPPMAGLALPLAALLYTLMTIDSARRHYVGRGGEWKGRTYSGNASAGADPGPRSPAELAAHVEAITKASGTSFYGAMRILPRERRLAMYAIYAFCRVVDDIADGTAPEAEKRAELARWRDEIDALYARGGKGPEHPVARALDGPIRRFALPREDFLAVIEGMELDAGPRVRIRDITELEQYCDWVACAVGRLSNRIFGADPALSDDVARHTGLALQLTNILRDVVEDAERDRLYLPLSRLRAHGLKTTKDIDAVLVHPATAKVCAELASKAAAEFAEADRAQAACDHKTMRPAIIMKEVYRRIHAALMVRGWARLGEPVKVSKLTKLGIALRHGWL
ncbi:squalene synthase HpnD [Rhodospirillum rubrum]|uniref:presqualene diphosphate synthase HpnD n=1 Tax=Rhodospirillum rubrum TaxID=1085 RepID=UPI0019075F48|nr:presqualene diphosphate synthase HpnD [Rhodospirillum rubrum]MBK1665419.1 squalene synthase HpnD [Rhodospirillum rubrum]MBK1677248.1 squalene synthase HpnD [Rhodospirillum rubrum]